MQPFRERFGVQRPSVDVLFAGARGNTEIRDALALIYRVHHTDPPLRG